MPRISESRPAAEPASEEQKERYRRILTAAAEGGARHGLERVQMQDVAKEAGVAIATLYRYFPSKTHMFIGVLRSQVDQLDRQLVRPRPGLDPVTAVSGLLLAASHQLFQQPRLAVAMLQSNNAAHHDDLHGAARIEVRFRELILAAAGIEDPTEEHEQLVRLIEQCWYGVLMSTLNGHTSQEESRRDIRAACELLLAPLSPDAGQRAAPVRVLPVEPGGPAPT